MFAQRILGPVAGPKRCSERERKQRVEENKGRWYPKFAYFNSLFSFPPHRHVLSIGIIFHLTFNMLPEELFGSLVSLFTNGLGTPPKLKTYHQQLLYVLP